MDLTAKELIELTKEIDQKCIDFAIWYANVAIYTDDAAIYPIEDLLLEFKKEKGL